MVSSSIFKVFGMTRPGIEPRSPGPLANTLTAGLMSQIYIYIYIYICVCVCVCVCEEKVDNNLKEPIRLSYLPVTFWSFLRCIALGAEIDVFCLVAFGDKLLLIVRFSLFCSWRGRTHVSSQNKTKNYSSLLLFKPFLIIFVCTDLILKLKFISENIRSG